MWTIFVSFLTVVSQLLFPPVGADAGEHSSSGFEAAGPPAQRGRARPLQDSRVAQYAQLVLRASAPQVSPQGLLQTQPQQISTEPTLLSFLAVFMKLFLCILHISWYAILSRIGWPANDVYLPCLCRGRYTRRCLRKQQTDTVISLGWPESWLETASPWCWEEVEPGEQGWAAISVQTCREVFCNINNRVYPSDRSIMCHQIFFIIKI